MSCSKQITIWCDRCERWVQYSVSTVQKARKEARKEGWFFKKGRDLCAECDDIERRSDEGE